MLDRSHCEGSIPAGDCPKPFASYIGTVQGLLGMSVVRKEVFIGGDLDSRMER